MKTGQNIRGGTKPELIKTAIKSALIICASVAIGILLLLAVFCLPNGRISSHVGDSLETLNAEGMYPTLIKGTTNTIQDNFSDVIMLNIASYNETDYSIIQRAMLAPRYVIDEGGDQLAPLNEHYAGNFVDTVTYGRYWHGYLIYLRPLLILFNYDIIRFLLLGVNLGLSALFIVLLYKKTGAWSAVAFVLVYILEGCFIGGISLMNFNMIFVTQISGIVLLQFYEKLKQRDWVCYFFLITGILTSFFDLLTFPVVTLGINLCIYVLLDEECSVKKLVLFSVMWGLGYAGMWVLKLLAGSMLVTQNLFTDAIAAANNRAGNMVAGSPVTYFDVLRRVLGQLSHKYIVLPYVLTFLCGLCWILKRRHRLALNRTKLMCLLFIIVIPFLWYFALKNHSCGHVMFTIRTLMPALIGLLLIRECFVERFEIMNHIASCAEDGARKH